MRGGDERHQIAARDKAFEQRIVGTRHEQIVKARVERRVADLHFRRHGVIGQQRIAFGEQVAQLLEQFGARALLGQQTGGIAFECAAQMQRFHALVPGVGTHRITTLSGAYDQPFLREYRQRLPDGHARDPKLFGELGFGQTFARGELALENHLAQLNGGRRGVQHAFPLGRWMAWPVMNTPAFFHYGIP